MGRHAEGLGGLGLPTIDGAKTGAEDLGEIGAFVEAQADHRRNGGGDDPAAVEVDQLGAERNGER
ncbi:hypothetical protein D3C72_2411840 [compost metagenome]